MANDESTSDQPPTQEITDSPWFWATVFSSMAVAGTIAIAPKYDLKQREIEIKQVGRERSAEYVKRLELAGGDVQQARRGGPVEDYDEFVETTPLLVQIAPVILLLSTVFLVSLVRFCFVQATSENSAVLNPKRGIMLLLAFAFYARMLYSIWSANGGVMGTAEKTFLIVLLAGVLLALGATAVGRETQTG